MSMHTPARMASGTYTTPWMHMTTTMMWMAQASAHLELGYTAAVIRNEPGPGIQSPIRRPVSSRKWRGRRADGMQRPRVPPAWARRGRPTGRPAMVRAFGSLMLLRRFCLPTSFRTVRVYRANAGAAVSPYRRWVTTSNRASALCSRSDPLRGVVDKPLSWSAVKMTGLKSMVGRSLF